ncbi:MAG: L-rhamnose mutarotase [Cyanobacteria bacterium]|nr:L-rhamnose mutarotase [Cyanobacteriota bacterium]
MKRYGSIIKIKPEKLEEYKKLHKNIWPGVAKTITECNIKNYSIFYKDGYLFSYFEYTGKDYDSDMKKMADDPVTQKWWDICKPMQEPLQTRKEGEWWAEMEEVFHQD